MKKDIEQKLIKIATENVNKKLEEERKKSEEKIKNEIDDVNFILGLIERKMLYKVTGEWYENQKFEMITKEIFLNDYMAKPKEKWHKQGISIKRWNDWKESYDLEIVINNEIRYHHIGNIIKEFVETMKDKKGRTERLTTQIVELEKQFNELKSQEKNIKKFIEDYNETNKQLNKEE